MDAMSPYPGAQMGPGHIDAQRHDPVNHPAHYTGHPSGVECIQITEHLNFCLGNAMKYLWRAGLKNDAIEDLQKARWYINREIERILRAE
ncbi:SaV-like [uncultured Caudovirales phage]|uniref:SaV-like n=1 Tax=uncultured Caudovirales phage TaxID=2100421 RepID=A0A6J5NN02_9CAUD|nr:SaV-like [uncultured Caudovirales phage]CAB4160789.1 SaV-like [uncultured Caudovirales phage]